MKKFFCPLVMALTLTTLTGCGLKGPLYFPPSDDKPTSADKNLGNDNVQDPTPARNDRATGDRPSQTVY